MISSLYIKNIALISELTLELKEGLNILSGETGAGKSIIIDSLNFVLGDRADRSLIRYGETTARVEVVFDNINEKVKPILSEFGIDTDEAIVVSRSMSAEKSECRINGRLTNLSVLREIVSYLIDIHSQNEHQSLMKASNHIKLIDEFDGRNKGLCLDFAKLREEYKNLQKRLDSFSSKSERERKIDILKFQISEIENANLSENEEIDLIATRKKYYNFQKIYLALKEAADSLDGNGIVGGISGVSDCISSLNSIKKYDESVSGLINRLESVKIELEDLSSTINDRLSEDGIENVDIDYIEKRLDFIKLLKKKYGETTDAIQEFYQTAADELYSLENAETLIAETEKQMNTKGKEIISLAKKLHNNRLESGKSFSQKIISTLKELGMKNTRFEVENIFPENDEEILSVMTEVGSDKLEFIMSPNVGEPMKPLIKIASGGELSRFMLAVKNVIAEIDSIGTLVFDEIDTGISGKIAKEVAMKLYNIATTRQVIAVTHLPQLAAMADVQYLISKSVINDKTITQVVSLFGDEIYKEIMRLTGSAEDSEIGLSHAKELKIWANSYKSHNLQ